MLLVALSRISALVTRLRRLFHALLVLFPALFIYALFSEPDSGGRYLVPALLGTLWVLLALAVAGLFHQVPRPAREERGFLRRQLRKLHRFLLYVLGAGLVVLTLAAVYLSVKMIVIWSGEAGG